MVLAICIYALVRGRGCVRARVCVCRMQGGREGRRDATVPKPSVIASLSTARPGSGHQSASPQITPISRGAEGEELKDSLRGEIPPRYSGGEHPRRQWGNSREQRCSGAEAGGGSGRACASRRARNNSPSSPVLGMRSHRLPLSG